MDSDMQNLAQVRQELGEKIEAVDRKVDQTRTQLGEKIEAVDRKVDQTRTQLEEKIEAVDRKVDQTRTQLGEKIEAVDRKVDQTRSELVTLITATATGLEHRMDKKLDKMEQRLVKATDGAVDRVLTTIHERFRYVAEALDDRLDAHGRKLDEHIANERIHHTHGGETR